MLSYAIIDELTSQLKAVSAHCAVKIGSVESLPPDEREYLHRAARISMIGASTRIENAVLTDAEVEWVDTTLARDGHPTAFERYRAQMLDKLSKNRERSLEEVAGCRNMLLLIYEQAREWVPLTEATICGLHRELLRFHPPAAHYLGRYKTGANSVIRRNHRTGEAVSVLQTADPGPITATAMRDLIDWYNLALPKHPWSVAVACEFVFRFLAIHPFQDGNGRLGRGLFLLALLQSPDEALAHLAPYLAIDRHVERRKEEYYVVLQQCSEGRYAPDPYQYEIAHFLRFMAKVVNDAAKDIDLLRTRYASLQKLSPTAHTILNCFKEEPERRMQTRTLCASTGLPRRTIIHAMNTLLAQRFLQKYGRGAGTRYQLVF